MPSSAENSPSGTHGAADSHPGARSSSRSPNNKRVDGKRCGVCGDRALGYNFNAITCESCKAFFRRNALKNKEYRCPFNDKCEVTAVTRRFCQRCRLRKCFEIGMKKEWIMTEEEKKKKRKKIEENRAKKGVVGPESPQGGVVSSPGGVSSPSGCMSSPGGVSTSCAENDIFQASLDADQMDVVTSEENNRVYLAQATDGAPGPLKHTSGANVAKPKAVVVGRVRSYEGEDKVRKSCIQADVHHSHTASHSVLKSDLPNFKREDHGLNFGPLPPVTNEAAPPHYALNLTQPHIHETSGNRCIVEGLLRSCSQGSAEGNSSSELSDPQDCYEDDSQEAKEVVVKFEAVDEPLENPCAPPASPPLSHQKVCPLSFPPVVPHAHVDAPGFEFSIREALARIQPGCRDRATSTEFSVAHVMESILNTAISAEYSAFSLLGSSRSSELNHAETLKITELLEASRGLNTPLCEEPNFKDLPDPSLINVINLTEIAIRRFIKMAKKISAFKTFCQEDQLALLKGGCTEMMILRSVSAYDPDKEVWKIQQDNERFKNIKLKILKAAPGNIYEEHKRFILSFHPEWRQDTQIIALLAAVALFTPERTNVIHPEAVRHEQSSYLFLLKRYLECKYGGCVGKSSYVKLLEIIGNLHILNNDHVKVFLEVNPQEVAPLLIEIFDLKQS